MSWPVAENHIVQLFDSPESRGESVADFVADGLSAGEAVVAVVVSTTWCAVAKRLLERGVNIDAAMASGRLSVLDAGSLLSKLLVAGSPDAARFDAVVGTQVRRLRRRARGVRIYGEMVDLLVAERDFVGARQLEACWNHLLAACPVTLFCGYSAVHFGDPRSVGDLRLICDCHSEVRTVDDDDLGAWLVKTATAEAASIGALR